MTTPPQTGDRKNAHLALAASPLAQSQRGAGFERVQLDHNALPECDLGSVDTATSWLGKSIAAPFFIGSMTGGTDHADDINAGLAEIAEACGIGIAVGSQRATLESGRSQSNLRVLAPSVPLVGNLGGVQIAADGGVDLARRAIDDLEADALFIHLNPLQEAAQPEGDTDWRGVLAAIEAVTAKSNCPILVKEVGAGISAALAQQLFDVGVYAVDVAGLGGTNWTRIEAARRDDAAVFEPFLDWGIPTIDALMDVRAACPQGRIIASGGIVSGLDAAKALWLGAEMVSMAGPLLKAISQAGTGRPDPDRARDLIALWKDQLRLALFLTGAGTLAGVADVGGRVDGRAVRGSI